MNINYLIDGLLKLGFSSLGSFASRERSVKSYVYRYNDVDYGVLIKEISGTVRATFSKTYFYDEKPCHCVFKDDVWDADQIRQYFYQEKVL